MAQNGLGVPAVGTRVCSHTEYANRPWLPLEWLPYITAGVAENVLNWCVKKKKKPPEYLDSSHLERRSKCEYRLALWLRQCCENIKEPCLSWSAAILQNNTVSVPSHPPPPLTGILYDFLFYVHTNVWSVTTKPS